MGRVDQLAELEALDSVFPGCLSLLPPDAALVDCLRSAADPDSTDVELGLISYTLTFTDLAPDDPSTSIRLRASLPRDYPNIAGHIGLSLVVIAPAALPRAALQELQQAVDAVVAQHPGEAVGVLAAGALRERAAEVLQLLAAQLHARRAEGGGEEGPEIAGGGGRRVQFCLGRMLIWR